MKIIILKKNLITTYRHQTLGEYLLHQLPVEEKTNMRKNSKKLNHNIDTRGIFFLIIIISYKKLIKNAETNK
jgi:hypothetical protein